MWGGVPQGGVLSPIPFSIHLRSLNEILPAEVRAAVYADDLLLYSRHSDPQQALLHLERAMGSLAPWLRSLGLSISIPKCQMCLSTRAGRDFSGVVLEVDGFVFGAVTHSSILELSWMRGSHGCSM